MVDGSLKRVIKKLAPNVEVEIKARQKVSIKLITTFNSLIKFLSIIRFNKNNTKINTKLINFIKFQLEIKRNQIGEKEIEVAARTRKTVGKAIYLKRKDPGRFFFLIENRV